MNADQQDIAKVASQLGIAEADTPRFIEAVEANIKLICLGNEYFKGCKPLSGVAANALNRVAREGMSSVPIIPGMK